jgi:hypothetical protein
MARVLIGAEEGRQRGGRARCMPTKADAGPLSPTGPAQSFEPDLASPPIGTTPRRAAFNRDGTLDPHRDQAANRLRFERPACPDCLHHRGEPKALDQVDRGTAIRCH